MHCFITEIETPQLVQIYKNVTGKEVKKFETRRAGIKRVALALAKKYETEFASNGTCVYAPPGMHFDMDALDFVPQTIAPFEPPVKSVDDKIREASIEKSTVKTGIVPRDLRTNKPAAKVADGEQSVKTSGNPVLKDGGSPAKGRRLGIGKRMEQLLEAGVVPKEIVGRIHEEFPASRATTKDVYLIRAKMSEAA